MDNTTHAGHGGKGSPIRPMDPGAAGNGTTEHGEMLSLNSSMVSATKWTDTTDKSGTTVNNNLYNIVNNVNRVASASNTNVSNHMNAFNGKATGVEVWYYLGDSKGYQLASKLSSAIASALGLSNRGAKATTDLYVVRETVGTTVLIEWCFIDNANDMKQYRANKERAINAALNVLGYKGENTVSKPKVKSNYYDTAGKLQILKRTQCYNEDWSKADPNWIFEKGTIIDTQDIQITSGGSTHARVGYQPNTWITLCKDNVKRI